MEYGEERVVALVDMDCFYVQVEQRLNPALRNTPCVVAQYKTWKGGGIIAVSYEARDHGVTRNMWVDDAKNLCQDLQVARVRELHGKADLTHYREASVEVIEVMSRFAVIERASIDEAYMDLTAAVQQRLKDMSVNRIDPSLLKTTYIQGYPQSSSELEPHTEDLRSRGLHQWLASLTPSSLGEQSSAGLQLTVGAFIVEEMRAAVEEQTGFRCSAGISHNKVLAKLACGLNKPNRQTILPLASVTELFNSLPIGKIRNLGGKLGSSITETLGVENMGDLTRFSQAQLELHFGDKTGRWLYDLCRGIEFEAVKPRQLPKSIGCSKNFPGKTSLATKEEVQFWLHQLALELEERLTKDRDVNGRVAKSLTVGVRQLGDKRPSSFSRCCALVRYEATKISSDSFAIIKSLNTAGNQQAAWTPPLTLLHISASKFSDAPSSGGITGFLSTETSLSQSRFSTSQLSNKSSLDAKSVSPCKQQHGTIQSFFQKATERPTIQKDGEEEVSVGGKASPAPKSASESHSGAERRSSDVSESPRRHIKSFFQKRSTERSSSMKNSLNIVEKNNSEDCVPVVSPSRTQCENPDNEQATDVELNPNPPSGASEDLLTCDRCSQEVLAWEMPEHNDYHFAMDLQKSFSSSSSSSAATTSCNISSSSSPPPLRGGVTGSAQSSRVKTKIRGQSGPAAKKLRSQGGSASTLDSFFKKN
uniref:DNA polymerase eta n=1 Tax=Gouania willdenowi TaxID=441366 RepID=A0A8C5I5X9_GOUWI